MKLNENQRQWLKWVVEFFAYLFMCLGVMVMALAILAMLQQAAT
jgi:hypothetical protein